jgi:uncharacterized protein (DUF4415 family)
MPSAKSIIFTRLADGTLLQRRPDGTFKPIRDKSDHARMARWTDAEIEKMATSDPDHPPLDDEFWKAAERLPRKEPISIKLDDDVLAFFRRQGRGYQTRINAVLRRYMQAQRNASPKKRSA